MRYILITAAYNEEQYIEQTLRAVVAQTVRPLCWVIVDDGSSDRTPAIVTEYAARYDWISLQRRQRSDGYSFARKAQAFNAAYDVIRHLAFDIVANLDADISFEPSYFEFLLDRFSSNPRLGVAGTPMTEPGHDSVEDARFNESDVFGACQVFRRACLEEIGGYRPIPSGGVDWVAVRTARMRGWRTQSFVEKRFYHHRPMGLRKGGGLIATFKHGQKDYFLGNHPVWQLARIAYQSTRRPWLLGGAVLLAGYVWEACRRRERPVPPELVAFHRQEELVRLRTELRHLSRRVAPPFRGRHDAAV